VVGILKRHPERYDPRVVAALETELAAALSPAP
jgi:hypothetical protein